MGKKNFKIFFAMVTVIMVVLFGSVFTSCSNDDDLLLAGDTQTELVSSLAQDSVKALTRAMNYSYTTYTVDQDYKDEYRHYKQASGACSWTSYVLAAAAIVRGKGDYAYPYNGSYTNKIDHVKVTCNYSTYMSSIAWYCQNYDNPTYSISCWHRTASTQSGALDIILDHRAYNDTPFLYIGSVSGIGHYLIIWDVAWTGNTSTSTVWYTDVNQDPVNNHRLYEYNVRTTNIQALLNQNVNTYYNFLCLY